MWPLQRSVPEVSDVPSGGLPRNVGTPSCDVPEASGGLSTSSKEVRDFSGTVGPAVAALFYSLIESAKLCGVEPRVDLGEAARRAIGNSGTVTLARDVT